MPMVPFLGQSYKHSSPNVSPEDTVNLIPEIIDGENAKTRLILKRSPGTRVFSDIEIGSRCRCNYFSSKSVLYSVFNGSVYQIDSNGDKTLIGNIGNLSSTVYIADDGEYLVLVDSQSMFRIRLSDNNLIQVGLGATDLDNPIKLVYLNRRMIAIDGESNKYFYSDFDNPLVWSGLGFNKASTSADDITSIAVRQGELWLFGKQSYEVHATTNDLDIPFSYRGGSASEIGCGAPNSVSQINENIFWLGSNRSGSGRIFMSGDGYSAIPISNLPIEHEIANIQDDENLTIEDAIGFAYSQEGHIFYCITFPSADITRVYDLTTNMWSKRNTRDPNKNIERKWEVLYPVYAYDKIITGSYSVGSLLELSLNKYDDWDGRPLVWSRISPVYWNGLSNVKFKSFTLDVETGVGLQSGQGSDPMCMIRISRDGGHTWSSQLTRKMGEIGKYEYQVRLNGLGKSRQLAIEVSGSDPVKVTLLGANLRYEVMGDAN